MAHRIIRSAGIALLSFRAFSQSIQADAAFEVASVKPHEARGGTIGISISGARFTAEANTLPNLIIYAYNLKSYQVPYSPALSLFGDIFYDIAAKAEDGSNPTVDQFRGMLRLLLAQRFGLQVHFEKREVLVYSLVAGQRGAHLKASSAIGESKPHWSVVGRNYEVTMPKGTMEDVVHAAERSLLDRPVIDKTGLTGFYQITMTYTPNVPSNRGTIDADDITIFTAVRNLGLSLKPEAAMMDVLVVDHVDKPSGN